MRIYLADSNRENHRAANEYMVKHGLHHRVLWSFYYYEEDRHFEEARRTFGSWPAIWADSGAYSAESLGGKEITAEKYADWLEKHVNSLEFYANLDEKRYHMSKNVKVGMKNLRYLEKRGFKPVPVFHGGEPWDFLRDLVAEYPYIALGGVAGVKGGSSSEVWRFYNKCYEIADGKAVFHGFGMTVWDVIKGFPWFSVDSSSWGAGHRFGTLTIFDERQGKFLRARMADPAQVAKHSSLIKRYGLDWRTVVNRGGKNADRRDVVKLSVASWHAAERWIEKNIGEIQIPTRSK